jgi:hypothetical protein
MNATTFSGGMGMRIYGAITVTQIGSFSGYPGVLRGYSSATTPGASYVAISTYTVTNSTAILFDNIKIGGSGITYIFRPFAIGNSNFTTAIIGLHNGFGSSPTPTLGIYWKYISSDTTTSDWKLYSDSIFITSIPGNLTINKWCKISIIRTGDKDFSSSFTVIGSDNTVTGKGSVDSATAITYNGWIWGNNSTTNGSKCMDVDYISAEFNSR